VKKAVKYFASDPRADKHRESLQRLLVAYGKPKKEDPGSEIFDPEPTNTKQEQDDYQAYIRALYASLASHCLCPRGDDGRKEITANLRLNSCCTPGELDDSVNFRLFFLDHPHHHGADGACQWQDAQVCVQRERSVPGPARQRLAHD
jgi:hypothetical protein